jgi:transcriptional regulator with GAF, ATPase, and Fis domain
MAFLLFANISNALTGSKAPIVFVFIMLVIGTGFFALVMFNQKVMVQEVKTLSNAEAENNESANLESVASGKIEKVESYIDIYKLLPVQPTEIKAYTDEILQNIAQDFGIVQAIFYLKGAKDNFQCAATYAYYSDTKPANFKSGETLPGQAVKNKARVVLNNIPENYTTIVSGLGKSVPRQLVFVPLKNHDEVIGLIEYATFEPVTEKHQKALDELSNNVADTITKLLKK